MGLVLGLRVRPPDLFRSAGSALLVPGAVLAVATAVMVAQTLGQDYFRWEMAAWLPPGILLAAAGLGLVREARWGWWAAVAMAVSWVLLGAVWVALTGGLAGLLSVAGPVLLGASVAAATRKELPAPEPPGRIVRGGQH